jgi:HD-like signal output (HDOD) protein
MKKWITGLFRETPVRHATDVPTAPVYEEVSRHEAGSSGDVDILFYRWISGAGEADATPGTDKLLLEELGRLAATPSAGANLVPRVPAIIPQLLRSLRDDNVSSAELAKMLSQDVVLVAEVIREVNSSYYNPAAPIKTIEAALMLLGQNGLRLLLARVSFRKVINLQTGRFAKAAAPLVWAQSEKCAQAATLLAPAMKANAFEAYLSGLMQNVGLIVAFRLIDQIYEGEVLPQSELFCLRLFDQVRPLSGSIAGLWDFPRSVATAIAQSGLPGGPALARVLTRADRISKLRMLVDAGQLEADSPFVLRSMDAATKIVFEQLRSEDNNAVSD